MKKICTFWVLIPLLFLLTACPYTAEIPLDVPSLSINKALLGKWIEIESLRKPSPMPDFVTITDAGKKNYQIEENIYDTDKKAYQQKIMKGYFTQIGKTLFLNLQEPNAQIFYFYKIELTDEGFRLFEVTDNIDEKFANSEELKAFFEKNKDMSFFYNKDERKFKKQ